MNEYIINIFGRECSSLAETVHPAALNDFSLAALKLDCKHLPCHTVLIIGN